MENIQPGLEAPGLQLKTKEGKRFEVTEEGSLGLLALGYVGLMLWRGKRLATRQHQTDEEGDS